MERLAAWITSEFAAGHHYSSRELENFCEEIGLSRSELRKAAVDLKNDNRFTYHDMGHRAGSHFEPVGCAAPVGATEEKSV